jgi:hypothetical protein
MPSKAGLNMSLKDEKDVLLRASVWLVVIVGGTIGASSLALMLWWFMRVNP